VQFASRIFKSFLAEMGISQNFTAPYTPQENPTERANRTVKTMIAQFAGQDQRNLEEKWPEIMLAVITSTSESTGHTLAFLTLGREPRVYPAACMIRKPKALVELRRPLRKMPTNYGLYSRSYGEIWKRCPRTKPDTIS